MELSFKYHYSYFLHPYTIDQGKYEKYLLRLLKDKKATLKIFEKENNGFINIYELYKNLYRA